MLVIVVVIRLLGPCGPGVSEPGCEPRVRVAIALGLVDSTVEMDHRGDALPIGRYSGRDRRVPREYVLLREVIQPRHVRVDAVEGLDRGTGNCCPGPGRTVCEHRSWRQIPVEFLQKAICSERLHVVLADQSRVTRNQ